MAKIEFQVDESPNAGIRQNRVRLFIDGEEKIVPIEVSLDTHNFNSGTAAVWRENGGAWVGVTLMLDDNPGVGALNFLPRPSVPLHKGASFSLPREMVDIFCMQLKAAVR